jgi:hypothetical protein
MFQESIKVSLITVSVGLKIFSYILQQIVTENSNT